MNNFVFILFLISIFVSYLIVYLTLPKLTYFIVDKPNSRSSHKIPKPTSGGISFVFSGVLITFTLGNFLPLICLPLALVGLIDDLFSLKNKVRYLVQVITSILLIKQSSFSTIYLNDQNFGIILLCYGLLILFVTAIINFINFMDGIDGLVCSCSIIILSVAALSMNSSLWIIVGSLIGFLFWNWSPSKIFMGDIGSTFLGAIIAGNLIEINNSFDSLNLLFVASPLLADAFLCVLRRLFAMQPIFNAHSLHLYQRLYQAGWDHSKITIQYLIATLFISTCSLFNSLILTFSSFIFVFFYGCYLDRKFAIPFTESLRNANINK